MSLINWRKTIPVSSGQFHNPFLSLQQELDKSIKDFYHMMESPYFSTKDIENLPINPSVDIVEDNDSFKVEAEMPGMEEEDIKVTINQGVLSIEGKKEISKKNENKNYVLREIGYGSYQRNITLPEEVDIDKAKASFRKGMLWVIFPKKEGSHQKRRELKVEREHG